MRVSPLYLPLNKYQKITIYYQNVYCPRVNSKVYSKLSNRNIMKSLVTSPTVYKSPLKENTTLEIFNNDTLIFSNSGKWLMPLFALEDFLKT